MKKVIFTQEWMALHPYEKQDATDQYYTELANKIYHVLDDVSFASQFSNIDNAKYLALCIAAYFEDVLSGTCIWKAFTTECKKRYDTYVPFYEKGTIHEQDKELFGKEDVVYNPDSINLADIKFLLWHHYQQSIFHHESLPPLFSTLEIAAKLIFNMLDKEYETAPENERLYQFLCESPTDEEHFYDYRRVLEWFHYSCYFHVGNRQRLMFAWQNLKDSGQFHPILAYGIQMEQMMAGRNDLLALSSAEWLAKVSKFHPAHKLWTETDFRSNRPFILEKEDAHFVYAKDLLEGDTIKVSKESFTLEDLTPYLKGEEVMVTMMFRFGNVWWQNGALASHANDKDFQKQLKENKDRYSHKQALADYKLLKEKGYGEKFVFLEDKEALLDFLKGIGYTVRPNLNFPEDAPKGIIVCGSPYTGVNVTLGLAQCISSKNNPYYDTTKADEQCFNIISGYGNAFPYELVCRLIDNGMLPDANVFASQYVKEKGLCITQENLQFLADYHLMGRKDKDLSPKELL